MTLELINTLTTCATFVVVAATAIAAIVQLRHLHASNQIVAFNELRASLESPQVAAAHQYVTTHLKHDLQDPAFRRAIASRFDRNEEDHVRVRHLLNFAFFFESAGLLVRSKLLPSDLVLESWSDIIIAGWKMYEPVTVIFRKTQDPLACENFEYLAVLAEDWLRLHPGGTYPRNVRRLSLEDQWPED